jgi:hypothetical protein
MANKALKFPVKVYVKREGDGDEMYLVCTEDPKEFAETDAEVVAGVYVLESSVKITAPTVVA